MSNGKSNNSPISTSVYHLDWLPRLLFQRIVRGDKKTFLVSGNCWSVGLKTRHLRVLINLPSSIWKLIMSFALHWLLLGDYCRTSLLWWITSLIKFHPKARIRNVREWSSCLLVFMFHVKNRIPLLITDSFQWDEVLLRKALQKGLHPQSIALHHLISFKKQPATCSLSQPCDALLACPGICFRRV